MKDMRKGLSMLLLVTMMITLLAACGGNKSSNKAMLKELPPATQL